MAHEISSVTIDGNEIFEAMYANRPAWHGLGKVFDPSGREAPDSATAIELAHLNWDVEKEDLQLAKDGKDVANNYAIVRQDTRDVLGLVGNDYQCLQNREGFGFLDSLMQDGIMRYESAFALNGGRQICLLARMPSVDFVTPDDALLRYILWCTSHDGSSAVVGMPTSVRVVCANTKRLAIAKAGNQQITLRHSGRMEHKLEYARRYLSQWDSAFTLFREGAQSLLKGYSPQQAQEYIERLFPTPKLEEGESARKRHARIVSQVRGAWYEPSNRLDSIKGTWWSLYNTVSHFVDHGKPSRQAKDSGCSTREPVPERDQRQGR